ncbi:MAG: hypothetical protein ACE361_00445 [Aureliella sp.]
MTSIKQTNATGVDDSTSPSTKYGGAELDGPEVIGKCRFSQLSGHYRTVFEQGANHAVDAFFIAEKNPESVLLAIPFYLLFGCIPVIFMYENRELFGGWRYAGWIIPLVILFYGLKAIQKLIRHYQMRRHDVWQYGLLLDNKYLVVRKIAMLDPWHCVWIPNGKIQRFYTQSEGKASGGGYNGLALKVAYTDAKGAPHSLKLGTNSTFQKPPYVLDKLLNEFLTKATTEVS